MKQKDLMLIAVIVIISAAVSYFASNALISSPKNRKEKVEIVEPISSDFKQPDSRYFNSDSVNPTKLIQIGDNNNPQPFH